MSGFVTSIGEVSAEVPVDAKFLFGGEDEYPISSGGEGQILDQDPLDNLEVEVPISVKAERGLQDGIVEEVVFPKTPQKIPVQNMPIAEFATEMEQNIHDIIYEAIWLGKHPWEYHPFYLRVYKYITIGQRLGYMSDDETVVAGIWETFSKFAEEQYKTFTENNVEEDAPIEFRSGERSPFATFLLSKKVYINGKLVTQKKDQKERDKLFRNLEQKAKLLKNQWKVKNGKTLGTEDDGLRKDLGMRLNFFNECKAVTFPGDVLRMNNLWSKFLGQESPGKGSSNGDVAQSKTSLRKSGHVKVKVEPGTNYDVQQKSRETLKRLIIKIIVVPPKVVSAQKSSLKPSTPSPPPLSNTAKKRVVRKLTRKSCRPQAKTKLETIELRHRKKRTTLLRRKLLNKCGKSGGDLKKSHQLKLEKLITQRIVLPLARKKKKVACPKEKNGFSSKLAKPNVKQISTKSSKRIHSKATKLPQKLKATRQRALKIQLNKKTRIKTQLKLEQMLTGHGRKNRKQKNKSKFQNGSTSFTTKQNKSPSPPQSPASYLGSFPSSPVSGVTFDEEKGLHSTTLQIIPQEECSYTRPDLDPTLTVPVCKNRKRRAQNSDSKCDTSEKSVDSSCLSSIPKKSISETQCPKCPKIFKFEKRRFLWPHYCHEHLLLENSPIADSIVSKSVLNMFPAKDEEGEGPKELATTCDQCGKTFCNPKSLSRHQYRVHGEGQLPENFLQCPYCPKQFKSKDQLNSHIGRLHEGTIISNCDQCGKDLQSAGKLWKHLVDIHQISPSEAAERCNVEYIVCIYCGDPLRPGKQLNSHVKSEHPENVEDFIQIQKDELIKEHPALAEVVKVKKDVTLERLKDIIRRKKAEQKQFKETGTGTGPIKKKSRIPDQGHCPDCGDKFFQRGYARHRRLKHGVLVKNDRYLHCPVEGCNEVFIEPRNLRYHVSDTHTMHVDQRIVEMKAVKIMERAKSEFTEYSCTICRVRLFHRAEVKVHMVFRHPEIFNDLVKESPPPAQQVEQMQCPQCDVQYLIAEELRKHVELNHSDICWRCPEDDCGKAVIGPQDLATHFLEEHTGENNGEVKNQHPLSSKDWRNMKLKEYIVIPVNCEICNRKLTLGRNRIHLRNVHKVHEDGDMLSCKCGLRGLAGAWTLKTREGWLYHMANRHIEEVNMDELLEMAKKVNTKADWRTLEIENPEVEQPRHSRRSKNTHSQQRKVKTLSKHASKRKRKIPEISSEEGMGVKGSSKQASKTRKKKTAGILREKKLRESLYSSCSSGEELDDDQSSALISQNRSSSRRSSRQPNKSVKYLDEGEDSDQSYKEEEKRAQKKSEVPERRGKYKLRYTRISQFENTLEKKKRLIIELTRLTENEITNCTGKMDH